MGSDDTTILRKPGAPVRREPLPQAIVRPEADILGWGYRVLAAMMIGFGVLGLVYGDFAPVWQRIPLDNLPYRAVLAYVWAILELLAGAGLLLPAKTINSLAAGLLVVLCVLWAILSRLPAVVGAPQVEANWLGLGENTVLVAGACIVLMGFADRPRPGVMRAARILFALALLPIGLSHFVYLKETVGFIPTWLPVRPYWAYLTGVGDIAAGLALLFNILPRLAAIMVTAMLGIITVLVWTPVPWPDPKDLHMRLAAVLISTAITAGAWIVADSLRGKSISGQ